MWTNSRCHIVQGPRLDDSVNGKPLIGGKCRIMRLAREHRGESSEKLYIDAFSVRSRNVFLWRFVVDFVLFTAAAVRCTLASAAILSLTLVSMGNRPRHTWKKFAAKPFPSRSSYFISARGMCRDEEGWFEYSKW